MGRVARRISAGWRRGSRLLHLWLVLAGLVTTALAGAPSLAQTIGNTAYARWTEAGLPREVASNRVEVTRTAAATRFDTYRLAPDSGARLVLSLPRCLPQGPDAAGAAQSVAIAPASRFRPGETIIFTLAAPAANRDPQKIDSLPVSASTGGGSRVELLAFETGPDSGLFAGSIATRRARGQEPSGDDCPLAVASGERVTLASGGGTPGGVSATGEALILADPFGMVFDSETGAPVTGARVTMRDAATGAPARVFAPDGVTPWPASVVSGEAIVDAAGMVHPMQPGRFWFPLAPPGPYRLEVEPPPDFAAPSQASRSELASLPRPDGGAFAISEASFGGAFALAGPVPVEVDIPVDRVGAAPDMAFAVSRPRAQPGDPLLYTLTIANPQPQERRGLALRIDLPRGLRPRVESVQIDGASPPAGAVSVTPEGRQLAIALDRLPAASAVRIAYAATIRADAPAGPLVSRIVLRDALGRSTRSEAAVTVERDTIAGRMVIIGRVLLGDCKRTGTDAGLEGVRVLLEDGSFAVTDAEGRYRFEGVVPGTHVVHVARTSLPPGAQLADCERSTRSAGDAGSRFVIGQGGSLARADFHVIHSPAEGAPPIAPADDLAPGDGVTRAMSPAASPLTATAETDWLALGDGPDGWLAPASDANPQVPAVRVAFRHRAGQTIRLYVDGKPVEPAAFDGTLEPASGGYAVSLWRGVPLAGERTVLAAEIVNSLGGVSARVEREIFFTSQPARIELLSAQSVLVADGVTRPLVVVRITDRNGRPVRAGVSGSFTLSAPFESAVQIEQNARGGIVLDDDDRVLPSDGQVRIQRNVIGFNRTLSAVLRNAGDEILFDPSSITNVLIGGTAASEGNTITASLDGVALRSVSGITIRGNTIALGLGRGILLANSGAVEIGGSAPDQGNSIGGNSGDAIYATNSSSGITILGNLIQPVTIAGSSAANGGNGIWLERASNVTIGGSGAGQGNTIAFGNRSGIRLSATGSNIQVIGNTVRNNARSGIAIVDSARAALVGNRLFTNGLLGIDLGDNGVTPNDASDGDSGPNDLLNVPQIGSVTAADGNALRYAFTLNAPAAAAGYRIEFFASGAADPSGFGEGERYLGHVDITHAGGTRSFSGTLTTLEPVSPGAIISATSTRRTAGGAWDITSEFSAVANAQGSARLAVTTTSAVFDPSAGNTFATPGNDILLTTTVSNAGTGSTDADTIFVAVAINPDTVFHNAVTPAWGGVVQFTSASAALAFEPATDLRFSSNAAAPASFAQCTYSPAAGYDPQVRHVCLNPKGTLQSGSPQGQFTVQIRTRIR